MNTDIGLQFNRGFSDFYAPGDAGESVVWDFSSIVPLAFIELETTAVSDGVQPELFPNPTLAFTVSGSDGTEYYELNENEMIYLGDIGDFDYQNVYSDGEKILAFPASMGTAFSDKFHTDVVQPGFSSVIEGSIEATVDGFGTVIMPWGTVTDALRTSATYTFTETIETEEGQTFINQISRQSHFWFASGFPGPIAVMGNSEILFDGETEPVFFESSTYISEITLSDEGAGSEPEVVLFPNPAKDQLNISISHLGRSVKRVTLTDISGRIVFESVKTALHSSGEAIRLDVSDLDGGAYIVSLHTSEGLLQSKVVIE